MSEDDPKDSDGVDEGDSQRSKRSFLEQEQDKRVQALAGPTRLRSYLEQEERLRALTAPAREQEERRRALTGPAREQAERLRALGAPAREQEERLRALGAPAREQEERLRALGAPDREQEERLRALGTLTREREERLRALVDPPRLRYFRERQERLRDLIDPPHLRYFREQQERFQNLIDPPALRSIREPQLHFRHFVAASEPNFGSLASTTAFARSAEFFSHGAGLIESALRLGRLNRDADIAAIAASGISKLIRQLSAPHFPAVGGLLDAGADLFESPIEDAPTGLVAAVPPEVFRALDLDATLRDDGDNAADSERKELAKRTSDELEGALGMFDPELRALLAGARQAITSDNPDRTRHVSISLRELLGHALRRLAPDAAIREWTQDPGHFHNSRPTRRARLEYLYEAVDSPALRDLVKADIRAALELFDALSDGSHVAMMKAGCPALTLLITRAEGLLLFLLRLEAHRNGDG